MTERAGLELDTLTIRIPIRLQRRGGRKLIMTPEGSAAPTPKPRRDETLVKALVRAHRWRRRIESGQAKSITDLAEQEGVTDAYVCRLLPLTCLAPEIIEAILDGRQPKGLRLAEMLGNGPMGWNEQRANWGFSNWHRPDQVRCSTVVIRCRVFDSPRSQQLNHLILGLGDRTGGSNAEADGEAEEICSRRSGLCTEAAMVAGAVGRQGVAIALNRFAIDWCGAWLGPGALGGP
jgi:hypothetical protein